MLETEAKILASRPVWLQGQSGFKALTSLLYNTALTMPITIISNIKTTAT